MLKNSTPLIIISVFLIVMSLIPVFLFTGSRTQQRKLFGGVFRIKSLSDSFNMQLDPAHEDSFIFISEQLYDGLVKLDRYLNIVPSLAEYWEISPDGKKYTFYLIRGIDFHRGGEVTAADVKFSLERLLHKETESPYYRFFLPKVVGAQEFRDGDADEVEGFKVIDEHTFEIHWTKPFVSALYLLGMHFCKVLPREQVVDEGRNFFMNPSGTGPFSFEHWVRDTRLEVVGVRLQRNPYYFRGMPYLDAVEFSPRFNLDHFFRNEIESIPVLSERLLRQNYRILQDGSLHPWYLGMSCHLFPLDNPQIRQAISLGINKQELVRRLEDIRYLRRETNNYIPFKLKGFFPDEENRFDLERARNLISQSGFSDEDEIPSLTFYVELPRTEFKNRIYRELRRQLSALGIDLRIGTYRSLSEVHDSERPYLILIDRLMSIPDPEDIIRPLFSSESDLNLCGFDHPEMEKLLAEADVEKSWKKRINLFQQMEKILFTDIPAVPLFTQENRIAMQPHVKGIRVPPLGIYYLEARNIWLEKEMP